MSKMRFFLSRSQVGLNSGIGMVGQSVLKKKKPTSGDLKPGDSLIFTNPTHPPSQQIDPAPNGNAGFIQKMQPFFKDFSRITLAFQGQLTSNIISQIVQKCTFPVHSNKTLRLELFASTSLHFSLHLS